MGGIAKAKSDGDNFLKTIPAKVEEVRYPKQIVWSGGCPSSGHSDGWKPYCHRGEDFNTAGDYLQKTSEKENSVFRVKKAGWYRINYFGAGERHYNYAGIW